MNTEEKSRIIAEPEKYTYFRLDFNFDYDGGDYTICETVSEVSEVLRKCEGDLNTDVNHRIEISGIAMTRIEYNLWLNSLDPIDF